MHRPQGDVQCGRARHPVLKLGQAAPIPTGRYDVRDAAGMGPVWWQAQKLTRSCPRYACRCPILAGSLAFFFSFCATAHPKAGSGVAVLDTVQRGGNRAHIGLTAVTQPRTRGLGRMPAPTPTLMLAHHDTRPFARPAIELANLPVPGTNMGALASVGSPQAIQVCRLAFGRSPATTG